MTNEDKECRFALGGVGERFLCFILFSVTQIISLYFSFFLLLIYNDVFIKK